jgi:hypothetical protein
MPDGWCTHKVQVGRVKPREANKEAGTCTRIKCCLLSVNDKVSFLRDRTEKGFSDAMQTAL